MTTDEDRDLLVLDADPPASGPGSLAAGDVDGGRRLGRAARGLQDSRYVHLWEARPGRRASN